MMYNDCLLTLTCIYSPRTRAQDFCVFNNNMLTKPYCYYYAVEWYHDQQFYGSMAIVKQPLCGVPGRPSTKPSPVGANPPPAYWYKPGYFPSEPTFVPSPRPVTEDDGALLFTAMHGATGKTYFVVVDARSMRSLSEVEVPTRMTFTTHGRFYIPH